MANKQQRGNREAKKPKKQKSKVEYAKTVGGFIDKAREASEGKK